MAIRQKKNVDLLSGFWRSLEKCLRFFALLLTLKNPHTCCLWGNDFFLFIQFTHLWPCCSPSNRTLKTVTKKTLLCRYAPIVCNYCLDDTHICISCLFKLSNKPKNLCFVLEKSILNFFNDSRRIQHFITTHGLYFFKSSSLVCDTFDIKNL